MYGAPVYLNNFSGLAQIEPHYFQPETPLPMQRYVTKTPLMRGDGIRPTLLPPHTGHRGYAPKEIEQFRRSPEVKQMQKQVIRKQTIPYHRNFGAPSVSCLPCNSRQYMQAGHAHGYGEANAPEEGKKKGIFGKLITAGAGVLAELTPEEKDSIKGGVVSRASLAACNKFGLFCPPEIIIGEPAKAPIALYLTIGAGVLGIAGLTIWALKD